MKQSEQPLYPKISSIYNKILQLAIAIVFIIVLMNLWLAVNNRGQATIEQHFDHLGDVYLEQVAVAVLTLMEKSQQQENNRKGLQLYLDQLGQTPMVKDVSLYDPQGRLLAQSSAAETVKGLFGLSPATEDRSRLYVPFVQELRNDKLRGYLRLSIEKSVFTSDLNATNYDGQRLLGIMLLMAGLTGFLLTRGFSRFSRQGYRLAKPNNRR
ncbi:AhpA/YtjB family protein [Thalassomonas sp. RHCl1]|uniref:AhpA/YtjB family protein n=1 Tax=Thalassomonas sp. RHCl1 TaxID=2995320 RepID=UPI00248D02A4|nr:AhpA/YtjB family protein [Thalassomonas sp. RHCl1]